MNYDIYMPCKDVTTSIFRFDKAKALVLIEKLHRTGSAAGDLRKLLIRQLCEFFIQGFDFLFQGIEFFSSFHYIFS